MTRFHFSRHGQMIKPTTSSDPSLLPLGQRQSPALSLALVSHLKQQTLRPIYTSPLQRAKETAAYLAALQAGPVTEDTRLRERANWGDLAGQSWAEFIAMWERCNRERSYIPPLGDSAKRLEAFVRDHAQAWPETVIVAVTHGGLIADFLLNVFSEEELARVNPAFVGQPYQGEVMTECSITTVHYHQGHYEIEAIASSEHLVGLDSP